MTDITGATAGETLRIAVVVAEFNGAVTSGLLEGARRALGDAGIADPLVVEVPGAFELPVVAGRLARSGFDGVVALGAVIEGETDHYEHVATQSIAGLQQVAVATGVPIGLGVLTVRQADQAMERSRPGPGNKGAEAAEAVLRTARALREIDRLA